MNCPWTRSETNRNEASGNAVNAGLFSTPPFRIGARLRLKIRWPQGRPSSNLGPGTQLVRKVSKLARWARGPMVRGFDHGLTKEARLAMFFRAPGGNRLTRLTD